MPDRDDYFKVAEYIDNRYYLSTLRIKYNYVEIRNSTVRNSFIARLFNLIDDGLKVVDYDEDTLKVKIDDYDKFNTTYENWLNNIMEES